MTNEWDGLPNAEHIDAILAHFEQHRDKWGAALDAVRSAAMDAAYDAALDDTYDAARGTAMGVARANAWDAAGSAARGAAWGAAWGAAYDAARGAAMGAAWGACSALIAWDDAGDLLAMPVDAVRLLAACNHHPAVLLLPAVIALAKE